MNITIPCKECPVLAMCKYKTFRQLTRCDTLRDMLYEIKVEGNHVFSRRKYYFCRILLEIQQVMKTNEWKTINSTIRIKGKDGNYELFLG